MIMKSAGFTLVELMVSVSIIVLMMGVGLPAFRQYGRRAELAQAGTDIQVALLQAHNFALAPESDKPSTDDYYGIVFDNSRGSFDLIRGINDPSGNCPASSTMLEHHVLPVGISMTPSTIFCIGYLIGRGAEPSLTSTSTAIALRSNRVGGSLNIQVNQVSGQVSTLQLP